MPARRPPGPSTHLALIVVGIAAFVLVLGVVGAVLTTGQSRPTPTPTGLKTARGAPLRAVPGRAALASVIVAGEPPDDILDVVALPQGAAVVPGSATNNGIGFYDHTLAFRIAAPEASVIDFYRDELPFLRWQLITQGPARNAPGYEVVAQHPSSDGYEWEMGVTVAPTVFASGPGRQETTTFKVRLFEETES